MKVELDNIWARLVDFYPEEIEWLDGYLTLATTNFNGKTQKRYVVENKLLFKGMKFPAGLAGRVEKAAGLEMGFDFEVIDKRVRPQLLASPTQALWLRDYQRAAVDRAKLKERGILWLPTGCHRAGTRLLMVDGTTRAVEDVAVGELLMGPDSRHRRVLRLCSGRQQMARIKPKKGEPFVVNIDHMLCLKHSPSGETVDVTVWDYLGWPSSKRRAWKLWRTGVDFYQDLSIPGVELMDPYFLGVLIGDGCLTHGVEVSNSDPEIAMAMETRARRIGGVLKRRAREGSVTLNIVTPRGEPNPYLTELTLLGLAGKTAGDKFIPHEYKVTSRVDRLRLLAGLLDTDGHLADGYFEYSTKSWELAQDISFVARSVGLAAYWREKMAHWQGGSGIYYRVNISGDVGRIPTLIARKQAGPRRQKKSVLVTGFGVELLDEEEFFGFELTGDGRYLLADFTVTHNSGKTELAIALGIEIPTRWLFVVHRGGLAAQAAERYELRTGDPAGVLGAVDDWRKFTFLTSTFQLLWARRDDPEIQALLADIGGIIVDECFPAGTMVGGVPIEKLKVGDMVPAFNEVARRIESKRVATVYARRASRLLQITCEDGRVIACTPEHPFWTLLAGSPAAVVSGYGGWALAKELQRGAYVCYATEHETPNLRRVSDQSLADDHKQESRRVLQNVPGGSASAAKEGGPRSVPSMPDGKPVLGDKGSGARSGGTDVLLKDVQSSVPVGTREEGGEEVRQSGLGAHEEDQPDAQPSDSPEGVRDATSNRSPAQGSRRERDRLDRATAPAVGSSEMATGSGRENGGAGNAVPLQDRHSRQDLDDRNRSGRAVTRDDQEAGFRPPQRYSLAWARVDSVEVLQQGGDGGFGSMCPDGTVYNIEVEDHHTYLANGFVVHNCHVLPANSFWRTAMKTVNAFYRIGLSGTPLSGTDLRSLYAVGALGPAIHRLKAETLIAKGVLSRPKIQMVPCKQELRPSKVKAQDAVNPVWGKRRTRGNWHKVQKDLIVESTARNEVVVEMCKAATKPGLVFIRQLKHARILSKMLTSEALAVDTVTGSDSTQLQQAKIDKLLRGDLDFIVCTVVLQEGVDIPDLRSVIVGTGGASAIAAIQRMGRGMRTAAGKGDFEVWDVLDDGNPILKKHAKARARAYHDEGHEVLSGPVGGTCFPMTFITRRK